MGECVTRRLIEGHLVEGSMSPGQEVALRMDQTLTQDATGTLVMLEYEAMGVGRVKTQISAQYVDHNLLQTDHRNADDHAFLQSACLKFGLWYSPPGNGVSHPVHQERFGAPGKSLVGSDSHTPAAGAVGMLAFGAGGLEVALAMAGQPLRLAMPKIFGVRLIGKLGPWVSAKDVILEMLRRYGVKGCVGKIIEYHGPGLDCLTTMDRHVIANMGTELGATTTVFPSDDEVRRFLRQQGRESEWVEIRSDEGCVYEEEAEIDLGALEPLIALPSSPGNVVPVREVAGEPIYQAYIGSSANPGLRDFAVPALMVAGRHIHPGVSFDVNPTSRQMLNELVRAGHLGRLLASGARIHQAGCNGCIGMGQAPATYGNSLRTVPRNFPGRSGTREDRVFLCSPETATASALKGRITDPRTLDADYPTFEEPEVIERIADMFIPPGGEGASIELIRGPNIRSLPQLDPLPDTLCGPVLIKTGDNVSTDEILPAGSRALPFRSNLPELSRFVFERIDDSFYSRAMDRDRADFFVVGGENYGQGSSREHAALAPRYLGLRCVVAKSFARIHWQNLVNFGVVPLTFVDRRSYDEIRQGDELRLDNLHAALASTRHLSLVVTSTGQAFDVRHTLSDRQLTILRFGGLIEMVKSAGKTTPDHHLGAGVSE